MLLFRAVLFACLLTLAAPFAQADHKIWTALLVATNSAQPKPLPPELQRSGAGLKQLFGFNQYELIGKDVKAIIEGKEQWLAPKGKFQIRAKLQSSGQGGYQVNFALFQDSRKLVENQARLRPGSPVFIRGPMHARGQLIIVFQIQH